MTDIQEVLDNARPACSNAVGPREQHFISRIIEQCEPWDPTTAAAETHPDDVISRSRAKGGDARLSPRSLLGVGRHHHAPPVRSISPTAIRSLVPPAAHDTAH